MATRRQIGAGKALKDEDPMYSVYYTLCTILLFLTFLTIEIEQKSGAFAILAMSNFSLVFPFFCCFFKQRVSSDVVE